MRKHLPIFILCLLILFAYCTAAAAADVEWQIKWHEDGSLQEEVLVSGAHSVPTGSGWEISSRDNKQLLKRELKEAKTYNQQEDRLPIIVETSNYIIFQKTRINAEATKNPNLIFEAIKAEKMIFTMSVPAVIRNSTADKVDTSRATWNFEQADQILNASPMVEFITVDGFLLGISILIVGIIMVCILFVNRMHRVDRIIEELYSLENITLDDLESEERY